MRNGDINAKFFYPFARPLIQLKLPLKTRRNLTERLVQRVTHKKATMRAFDEVVLFSAKLLCRVPKCAQVGTIPIGNLPCGRSASGKPNLPYLPAFRMHNTGPCPFSPLFPRIKNAVLLSLAARAHKAARFNVTHTHLGPPLSSEAIYNSPTSSWEI